MESLLLSFFLFYLLFCFCPYDGGIKALSKIELLQLEALLFVISKRGHTSISVLENKYSKRKSKNLDEGRRPSQKIKILFYALNYLHK